MCTFECKVAQGCEKPWSSPHAAALSKSPQVPVKPTCRTSEIDLRERRCQCLNSFPQGSRGANRTSAVPFLPLVAVPHKRTIDPRQPNPISGMEGEPCRVGSNRFPHDSRLVEWKLAEEEKLLCEARKSEHARRVSECSDWA